MRASLLQKHFNRALLKTGRVIPSRPQIPVLNSVLLSSEKGQLCVIGSNVETTMVTKIGSKSQEEGGICVPAKLLGEFVSTLPEGTVELETKEGELHVSCEGYEATIPGMQKEEYPPVPVLTEGKDARIPKEKFKNAVASVIYAAALDEGRPVLTGIKIKRDEDDTTLVATDGYRLSLKKISLPLHEGFDALIPARALGEVIHIGEDGTDDKDIAIMEMDDAQIGFSTGETDVFTRKINGEYPNYTKILPKNWTTKVELQTAQFSQAVKSAAIFAKDNANIVKVSIQKDAVLIAANTPQIGKNQIQISGKTEGEDGEIAFNSRFLLEFLAHFEDEILVFEMNGALNPGAFHAVDDDSFLHIIMPVRVSAK